MDESVEQVLVDVFFGEVIQSTSFGSVTLTLDQFWDHIEIMNVDAKLVTTPATRCVCLHPSNRVPAF